MLLVSHSDDDHINGVLELMDSLERARSRRQAHPFKVRRVWHNSFADIVGSAEIASADLSALLLASSTDGGRGPADGAAAVVSVRQARQLRLLAESFDMTVNQPFGDLVRRAESDSPPVDLGHGLSFTVLGPDQARIDDYRVRWAKDLKEILRKEKSASEATALQDNSPFNLASIVVIAELDGKTMLLTGDARGDFIIEWLVADGRLVDENDTTHFDLLKVPHHGSANNVTEGFFRAVTADHYVISGDGKHDNPEAETLSLIASARKDAGYTIHLTITEDSAEVEDDPKRKRALESISGWVINDRPPNCTMAFREGSDALSVRVDLHDALDF
jgi:hypothetical protein